MHNDQTPHPHLPPISAPGRLNCGSKAIVRRARLEHLAAEFLRLGDALRLPVPIQRLYENPPLRLWKIEPSGEPSIYVSASEDNLVKARLEIARAIARLLGESAWEMRIRLLGDKRLSVGEVDVLALALLLPTMLLSGISERQRTATSVALIFQVPYPEAAARLTELGYAVQPASAAREEDITR